MAKHIVLGVTGSIAAYKAADIIRRLKEKGLKVSVVMTQEAEHFITPLTLSALNGGDVYRDMFENRLEQGRMPHIELAKADLLLIAPATANIIGKLAYGLADDLLTCIALATKAPIIIAPAMNTEMLNNPLVQKNCETLEDLGVHIVFPVEGDLACGTHGLGHIAEVESIIKTACARLSV